MRETIAGEVAVEVAQQLAEPLRSLRDRLGLVVDQLERHVATSTGPTPYPWRSLQVLRQDLASTYLEVTALARRLDELDRALDDDPPGWFDLPAAVDLGLRLATHHLGPEIELLFDLGHTAPARCVPGTLSLIVAQMVGACAVSARATPGSTLSVRVTADGGWGVVLVADNGNGNGQVARVGDLARELVLPWGASVEAASEVGQGCAFEIRLIVRP